MKRFTKKILAKYIQYIEIIGYFFVLLFIAGLIALSFIKAEDEFVHLTGELKMPTFIPEITLPQYLIKSITDSVSNVQAGDTLYIFSNHEKMIQDLLLLQNIMQQIEKIPPESDKDILMHLNGIIHKIKTRKYHGVVNFPILSSLAGDFFNFIHTRPQLVVQRPVGGVFDFQKAQIEVNQLPADKQMVKKLKSGQTGTATLNLNAGNSIQIPVTLFKIDKSQASFIINSFPTADRRKFASELCKEPQKTNLAVNISVLVGGKSWMRLIWR